MAEKETPNKPKYARGKDNKLGKEFHAIFIAETQKFIGGIQGSRGFRNEDENTQHTRSIHCATQSGNT